MRSAFPLMVGRGLAFLATFCVPLVLVRIFTQAEFGTYKQIFLVYATLYGIAQCGLAESLYYFLPRSRKDSGRYVGNAVIGLALAGLVFAGLLMAGRVSIASWFHNVALADHIGMLAAFLLMTLLSATLEIVLVARRRYVGAAAVYFGSDLARAACMLVPALAIGSLRSVLAGAVVFSAMRLGASIVVLRREIEDGLRPDPAFLKEQLGYALPFGAAVLVEALYNNLHSYAVAHYFDAATFAIYAVGCLQIPFVEFVASSAGSVLMVQMGGTIAEGHLEEAGALWRATTRKLALVFFPLVGCLIVAAPELIRVLFTEAYGASVPIFMIGSTTILLSTFQTDAVLRVRAETRFLLFMNALRLLLIGTLIHRCIAGFGLWGAVGLAVAVTAVGKALALARIKAVTGWRTAELLPWRSLAGTAGAAVAAAVMATAAKAALGHADSLRLAGACAVYGASYLALVILAGLLGTDGARRAAARLVGRLIPRAGVGAAGGEPI